MSRKVIGINKNIYNKIKKCKVKDTERNVHVISRLLDKYEQELLDNAISHELNKCNNARRTLQ